MSHIKLASAMCATCIFKPNAQFDLDEFRKRWGEHRHQTCHQFRTVGQRGPKHPDVWCRGFFELECPDKFKAIVEVLGLVEIVEQKKPKP